MSVERTLRAALEERADALPQVRPDVAGLMADGERARAARRRHRLVMVAAAATVVAIVVVSFRFVDRDSEPRPIETPDPVPERTLVDTTVVDDVGSADSSRDVVIDPAAQRVYVGQNAVGRRAGGVAVVDATSQTLVDTVEIGSKSEAGSPYYVGGLALDAPRQLLYVSYWSGEQAEVAVVSTASNEVIDTIEVRLDTGSPNARLRACCRPGHRLPVPRLHQPAEANPGCRGQCRGRGHPHPIRGRHDPGGSSSLGPGAGPGRQSVFVTGLEDEMQVIDTGTRTIVDTIEDVGWPGPMAADPASGLVLLCNEAAGTVTIVDADTHEVLKTLEVGAPGPFGVAVDSQARRAYVDDKVIDLETLEVAGWLRPQGPGRVLDTVAVHPDHHTAYARLRGGIGDHVFVAFTPPPSDAHN